MGNYIISNGVILHETCHFRPDPNRKQI